MGQGSSTNTKQQPEKADSVQQLESVEPSDEDDTSRIGSLKKNKWLRQKSGEEKPKKTKKNDKKKKKKDDPEEVSSATCISESDRSSLRHSRIELHLEECQPAPDEDDAISLSSCGEDPQKNLKDIENEEPSSFLNCDDSSSSNMTASPGESLSSGQDSGFVKDNTIHSVSSEEEHTETSQKNKKDSSNIDAKLITPKVKIAEKCTDYIEQLYPFNSCSPANSPVKSVLEDQTKKEPIDSPVTSVLENQTEKDPIDSPVNAVLEDQTEKGPIDSPVNTVLEDQTEKDPIDSPVEINLKQENFSNTISTSTVPTPKLESQSSITETPKVESQTEIMKESDLVTGMVKELVNETLESAVEYLTNEYKRMNIKQECNEVNQQESILQDDQVEERQEKELNLSETPDLEITEKHMALSDMPLEPFQDKVSGAGTDDKHTPTLDSTEKTEANEVTTEEIIITNKEVTDSLNQELVIGDISMENVDSVDSVNIDNVGIIDKGVVFQELSYSLEVKPLCEEESKSETETTKEVVDLQNCDSVVPDYPLLATESENSADDSMEAEVSKSASSNSHLNQENSPKPEVVVESNQNEEPITECPTIASIVTDLDAEDRSMNESGDCAAPDLSLQISEESMTENSQILEDAPSLKESTPENITAPENITINESQDKCTESSSGSAASPQLLKESKGIAEQSPSSETQPIPDNTNGAVFV